MAQPLQQSCRGTLLRYTLSSYVFQDLEGCRRGNALHPLKRALWHLPCHLSKGVSHFKLPLGRCRGTGGVSQLQCRLSRYNGPLSTKMEIIKFESKSHVYLNSVQQMVSGELAGEGLQTGFSRHGLPPQRAELDTVYPPQRAPKQCPAKGVRRIL